MVFNVSVGDFICLINLIVEILGALEQSHGAAAQFQDLMGTFESLKDALSDVESFDCNSEALSAALKRAERSVERFLKKVEKYQPSLEVGGSKNKWKDTRLKIQWALYRKDDVNEFRAEISMHLYSIQLLLLSACRVAFAAERKEILEMRTYMMSADGRLNETRSLLMTINSSLSQWALQMRDLLQSILRTNVTILNAIIFARFRYDMPMSICWDQPVSFQDATGRRLPINTGFINSWESFQQALLNLHKDRPGFRAVENYHYKLQDAKTAGKWAEFATGAPFEQVFAPGGYIDMTVVFPYDPQGDFECPRCGWPEGFLTEYSKIECSNPDCDLNYTKSDYLCTDILTLPAHFELPPVPVILSEAEKLEVARESNDETAQKYINEAAVTTESVDKETAANAQTNGPQQAGIDDVNSFRNIYITKPPAAMLKDRMGIWYTIPWRVAHSFDGIEFIINHYTTNSNTKYKLRDREVGWVLNQSNWQARAWPGMCLLLEDASGSEAPPPRRPSPAAGTAAFTLRCLLCRKLFGNDRALRRHTASTHLSHQTCPPQHTPCSLCASFTV